MTRKRYYHRFLREGDLEQLEEASKYLFAFDPHEVSLKDVIRSERWFCLSAVSAGPDGEQIVGFVAAALGSIKEFPQEQQYLQDSLSAVAAVPHLSSSGTSAAASPIPDHHSSASAPAAESPDGSSSSSSDALALEVVLLGVVADYRRRGVASRLLKQVKTHARTRGASLLFLHVQTTNTPARSLYQQAGFTQAALLPDYYTFKQDLQQQQQQQPAAAMQSSWGLDEFSGNDAALLVMQLEKTELARSDLHVAEAATAAAAASGNSSSSSSKGYSKPSSSSDAEELAAAAAASRSVSSKDLDYWQQQQQPLSSSSSSGSTTPDTTSAAKTVSAAAAAAARLLLGPAIGLLGLTPKHTNSGLHNQQLGRRGELVDLGNDEIMVQVREGSNVYVFDPDEVPDDVVLSDQDLAVLKRQRQQQRQQQQKWQQQHNDNHHDDDGPGGSVGGGGGVPGIPQHQKQQQQQQQQQQQSAAVSAAFSLHRPDVGYLTDVAVGQQCSGHSVSYSVHRRQRRLQVQQGPAVPNSCSSISCQQVTAVPRTIQINSRSLRPHQSIEYVDALPKCMLVPLQHWNEHWSCRRAQQLRYSSKAAPLAVETTAQCGSTHQQRQRRRHQGTWQWRTMPTVKLPSLAVGFGLLHPFN